MSDQAMQADGGGAKRGDPTGAGRSGGGESGGGASAGKQGTDGGNSKSPIGHGGQSEIGYHGPGQLGDQKVDEGDTPNAKTKGG